MCRKWITPFVALCLLAVALPVLAEDAATQAQQQEQGKVAVAKSCQKCGDGYCAPSCENERTCPADCAPQTKMAAPATARCGKCGDGQCVASCGENAQTCPKDCGGEPSTSATAQCDEAAKPKAEAKKE